MRAFRPAELLELWEAGTAQPRWDWARRVLCAGWPELGIAGADALTVGERDARLLELREALFGPELAGRSTCPVCGTAVEMELTVAQLRVPEPGRAAAAVALSSPLAPEPEDAARGCVHEGAPLVGALPEGRRPATPPPEPPCGHLDAPVPHRLVRDDLEITLRAPNLRDLAETANAADPSAMRTELLARCVCVTRAPSERLAVSEWPAPMLDDVLQHLAAVDPGADLRFDLVCPHCRHRWSEAFDIVSFLWAELDAWAQRTLDDVHALAAAYGWTEADTLALSPRRRAHYLERVNA